MSSTSPRPVSDRSETEQLLERLSGGDAAALDQVLEDHRDYLRRLLEARMEDELRSRVDPSDVIQETQLVVSRRINDFLDARPTTFKLWLRGKALEKLIDVRRKHVAAAKRSVRREVALPEASSLALAQAIVTQRPSAIVQRRELSQQTNQAIAQLSHADREVLLLRHVEDLTNTEVAEVLSVTPDAASKRYGRAILRLRRKLIETGALSKM